MRLLTLVLGASLACGTPPAMDPAPVASEAEPRHSLRGTRLVLPSDRAVEPLEVTVASPVSPGDTATAAGVAPAGSRCTIEVTYRSGPSEAQGLGPATAGEDGALSWTWIIGINTTPGDWVVAVECVAPDGAVARGHARLAVAPRE